jgi:hypothetical protein
MIDYTPIYEGTDEILLVYCAMIFRDRRSPLEQYCGTGCAWCDHFRYNADTCLFTCNLTGESALSERRKHYPKCPHWTKRKHDNRALDDRRGGRV